MKKVLNPVLKYLGILGGSLIYAAAIALFLEIGRASCRERV